MNSELAVQDEVTYRGEKCRVAVVNGDESVNLRTLTGQWLAMRVPVRDLDEPSLESVLEGCEERIERAAKSFIDMGAAL